MDYSREKLGLIPKNHFDNFEYDEQKIAQQKYRRVYDTRDRVIREIMTSWK